MVTEVLSAAINGIDSKIVVVETDISTGLPCMEIIGSIGTKVRESKERVRVALKNNGISFPACRITINLSPADVKKDGTGFDLAIAVSLLAGLGKIPEKNIHDILFAGELGLDGQIKRINGILPIVLEAKKNMISTCIIPKDNSKEANVVEGINIIAISHLEELITYFNSDKELRNKFGAKEKVNIAEIFEKNKYAYELDFADVAGQESVKRAMELAAAGFHNILMVGPPGGGKTMMAKRLPTILPALSFDESMELSKIYSVCGLLSNEETFKFQRPFLNPHHTISSAAMAGGGKNPSPGIITKAHKGVLFLDEIVHFPSSTLELLRQPIEDKKINIVRTDWNCTFPADFMLVAAMNPCPCGYYPDNNICSCSPEQINRYIGRLSGPILDRFDICVETGRIDIKDINNNNKNTCSEQMRENVLKAVEIQKERYKGTNIIFNSQLQASDINKYIYLSNEERDFIEKIYEKMHLSLRAYHRILKVSRTIADLDSSKDIKKKHIMEAVCYRSIEDKYWGGVR